MLVPAAHRAVVPRLSPRMREQVREHAITQGGTVGSVLQPMEGGSWQDLLGTWGGEPP